MDKNQVVETMRRITNEIIEENGYLNLCMLVPDNDQDTFTLFISAKWLDNMKPFEGTKHIVTYIFKNQNKEFIRKISRVSVVRTTDKGVLSINHVARVENSIVHVENCSFNNVVLPSGIIFESRLYEHELD